MATTQTAGEVIVIARGMIEEVIKLEREFNRRMAALRQKHNDCGVIVRLTEKYEAPIKLLLLLHGDSEMDKACDKIIKEYAERGVRLFVESEPMC